MRVKHFPTRTKFPHIPNNAIQIGNDDNNFEYDANPEWIPVSGVANNEIWILAFDGSADIYSAFTCSVANGGTYNMDIIGGVDGTTVLSTYGATASGGQMSFQIPSGTGKYCSLGYYTYKIRIYATVSSNNITAFTVAKHASSVTVTKEPWKIINFGTKYLTTLQCYNYNTSSCPYLLYANTYYCVNISNQYLFQYCTLMEMITMPKFMDYVIYLGSTPSTTGFGGTFRNCTSLRSIKFPSSMNSLAVFGGYTGNGGDINMGACLNCTSLTMVILPNSLVKLTNFGGLASTNPTNAFGGCTNLQYVYGAINLPVIQNMSSTFSTCSALLFSEDSVYSTNSIPFSSSGLGNMTIYSHPALRVSSFLLTGTSNASRSLISSINIDWANSNFGGTGNVDIRYNSLSATELDRIFTALPTVAGTHTIYVASNVGSASCTPSIATAKNWTVVTA